MDGFYAGDRIIRTADAHADCCITFGTIGSYRYIVGSVIGAKHLRDGRHRDDAVAVSGWGPWLIIAMADGVSACEHSRLGAAFCVDVVIDEVFRRLKLEIVLSADAGASDSIAEHKQSASPLTEASHSAPSSVAHEAETPPSFPTATPGDIPTGTETDERAHLNEADPSAPPSDPETSFPKTAQGESAGNPSDTDVSSGTTFPNRVRIMGKWFVDVLCKFRFPKRATPPSPQQEVIPPAPGAKDPPERTTEIASPDQDSSETQDPVLTADEVHDDQALNERFIQRLSQTAPSAPIWQNGASHGTITLQRDTPMASTEAVKDRGEGPASQPLRETWLREALGTTHRYLLSYADKRGLDPQEVACTLQLLLLNTETGELMTAMLGDGLITALSGSGRTEDLPQYDEDLNDGVLPLSDPDWNDGCDVSSRSAVAGRSYITMHMMTDGVKEACVGQEFTVWAEEIEERFRPLQNLQHASTEMLKWMLQNPGPSGDDLTLAVIFRSLAAIDNGD